MKISIVTPSFNQLEFLKRNVASVREQVRPKGSVDQGDITTQQANNQQRSTPICVEHIVIDGGSTDGSAEWLAANAEQLSTGNYQLSFVSEKDEGQTDAINKGLHKATGEIIGWLNSDDIYFPGAFEKVIRAFDNNPSADVIYGNGVWVDENDQVVWRRRNAPFHFKTWLYGMADPFQPETFYRRRVLEKGGYLDKTFFMMMDREWWMRLAVSGCRFQYVNDEFAALRRYGETKSAKFQERNNAERQRLHDKYWTGFRFENPRLRHAHWKILHVFYLALRRVRILINRVHH